MFLNNIFTRLVSKGFSYIKQVKLEVQQSKAPASEHPVLLVELLEAPWWVLNAHVSDHPESPMAQLMRSSVRASVTTMQPADNLRYWVSSASLMRGVTASRHGMQFLNQTDPMAFPPLWTLAAAHGCRVGVWGTAYSHAWKDFKSESLDFYLPDKFGPDDYAHPRSVIAYQRILRLLSRLSDQGEDVTLRRWNVRVALFRFLISRAMRMRFGTLRSLFRGDGLSLRNKHRILISARIAFYEFVSIFTRHVPDFSTLSLGTLASAMHLDGGYYRDAERLPPAERVAVRADTLVGKALQELDLVIADLLRLSRERGVTLLVVSGYGQIPAASFHAMSSRDEIWTLRDAKRLLEHLGVDVPFTRLPSMFPCTTLSFYNNKDRNKVMAALQRICRPGDQGLLFYVEPGDRCLSVKPVPDEQAMEKGRVTSYSPGGLPTQMQAWDIGVRRRQRQALTGEHALGGVLIVHQSGIDPSGEQMAAIPEESIARFVMGLLDVSPPDYMCAMTPVLENLLKILRQNL